MKYACNATWFLTLLTFAAVLVGCQRSGNGHDATPGTTLEVVKPDLPNWKIIGFGGEGEIFFKDGVLNLDRGQPMTGLVYTGDTTEIFGKDLEGYVIECQARRVDGLDMFLGLTFPVGKAGHVSLVLGGWSGAITGLSNLDGLNASENETTQYKALKDGQWYTVKLSVSAQKIECWLDGEKIVDVTRSDYSEYTTHSAVVDTVPFGLFTYDTWGAIRGLRVTRPSK